MIHPIVWSALALALVLGGGAQSTAPSVDPWAVHEATVVRVLDGDTFEADVDLEFGVSVLLVVRVHAYNAAELNTPEGRALRDALARTFAAVDQRVLVRSYRGQRTFARWVCDVWIAGVPFADAVKGR